MRHINKPTINVSNVFPDCVSITKSKELKRRLENSLSTIVLAEADFESKIKGKQLYTVVRHSMVSGNITKDEMEKVYTQRMVPIGKPGRKYYDQLLAAAPIGKCPLCAHRTATTLDHYLPKADYPIYSVTPINLIPACYECNFDKKQKYPTSREEETLHPYYDDVEMGTWLHLRIKPIKNIGFEFYVDPPTHWDDDLKQRTIHHFSVFGLNDLYVSQAVEELSNIYYTMKKLYLNGGEESLKEYLFECYESRKENHENSWQTAFYNATSKDTWFLNGGFLNFES